MHNRWIFAVLWLAVVAGFVYLRNRMVMGDAGRVTAQAEGPNERWSVPPLMPLPSDTTTPAYAAAHFSGSAYRAWLEYNDALTRLGDFLEPPKMATPEGVAAAEVAWRALKRVSLATADSIGAAAATARNRLERGLPHSSVALAEFQQAVSHADSLVARMRRVEDVYFATVDSLVNHVKQTRPSATDDGAMLEFDEHRDVAIYNRSFARMQAASRIRIAAMTALHDHTFELLRQLSALN
jgi:hypothetical protein